MPPAGGRRSAALPRLLAAAAAGLLLLAGCADDPTTVSSAGYIEGDGSVTTYPVAERQPAPEVSGETLDGEPLDLADYRGQVVVVNFWASWCPPCRAETPALEEVYTENRDRGLAFVGIDFKDTRTAAQAFVRNYGVSYPSLYDQPGLIAQSFHGTVPPAAIPSTLVIDREGRIAARVIGSTTYTGLTELVEPVLAEGEPDGAPADGSAEPSPAGDGTASAPAPDATGLGEPNGPRLDTSAPTAIPEQTAYAEGAP
ncbi:TlpA family protein disulfide reductase [Allonocardiopsis opalescens]|uniref:TlpA family protein disulfide reductase n=1 Tax=Allonocardiopsis opalescens TaxID=1144618 RepID=UPI000D071714|nr:TlpA disulfide reductase family protein [Allonocardiopsis opalescens]